MSLYLLLNILIISVPLLFSFEKNLRFYKKLPSLVVSFIIISGIYIIWDVIATTRGDWKFNPKYITSINIFSLPLEEILFFITVLYSSVFIFETLKFYLKESKFNFSLKFFLVLSIIFVVIAFLFFNRNYTFTVLLFCASFFILAYFSYPGILRSKIFWFTILLTYVPFLIVNYILTSFPVVEYNENEIWGIRILSIPMEDFFYSFSMISLWLLVYSITEHKFRKNAELT